MNESQINISGSYEGLCEKVTQEILDLSRQKLAMQERFTIALAGGSTPKGVYQCMASPAFRDKFQWAKIHFFWGDERCVPHEDARSNFRMVSEVLLTKIKIPSENIHPVATQSGDAKDSASRYEETIRDFFGLKKDDLPVFDLVLLGLGEDGHTASLFPGNPALLVKDHLVVAASQPGIPEERISLSLPVINSADKIFFVVSGQGKAEILHKVLDGADKNAFPAQHIDPSQGKLTWFLDKPAASQLAGIPKRIGIASDHGGYLLKKELFRMLCEAGYEVIHFGAEELNPDDDYPDFVIPLSRAVSRGEVDRGIAICSSGVGACIAANKVAGARACMVHETFSARQGVEDDDMNVICLGSKVLDQKLAWELVTLFLGARFSNAERHRRRLAKVAALEK